MLLSALVATAVAGHCNYAFTGFYYMCNLSCDTDELIEIIGDHLDGFDDANVTVLVGDENSVNSMSHLNRVILDKFPNLDSLGLSSFKIETIAADAFDSGVDLQNLNLSYNELSRFNFSIPTLKKLNINGKTKKNLNFFILNFFKSFFNFLSIFYFFKHFSIFYIIFKFF
jgi:hypothetical protein